MKERFVLHVGGKEIFHNIRIYFIIRIRPQIQRLRTQC